MFIHAPSKYCTFINTPLKIKKPTHKSRLNHLFTDAIYYQIMCYSLLSFIFLFLIYLTYMTNS